MKKREIHYHITLHYILNGNWGTVQACSFIPHVSIILNLCIYGADIYEIILLFYIKSVSYS